ncbi:molybdopterin biosynthesis protein [Clostridium sp. AF19-22AC]|jgi:putative molybdopterin biosynthesis protein|uniref:molybdopterin biosynthesis protein n=1 Tax=Clostridia TaxID=186801 RepID=UPI000E54359F|nr:MULTISPECIES: molybdopterin biosynthesis protein [Clostridia]RHR31942.1 molybdopterin biosynthesis protein [Clostridium sp. AF19-22AC]
MGRRNLYLNTIPAEEAAAIYRNAVLKVMHWETQMVKTEESLGRITASAVYAKYCSPLYNAAAMDGIAVISAHTATASEVTPLVLKQGVDYQIVDTGDPVRMPYDAVIMAEDLLDAEEDSVKITASVPAWQHIRPVGEDIVAGEMLLAGNHKIRPIDIGVLLSGGIVEIEAIKKPKAGIIPTGTEIIEADQVPREGDIIESNSRMFAAMTESSGGIPRRYPPIPDDYEKIKHAVQKAVKENDIVIVNAGSSAGTEDYTVHILKELGEVLVHGVAIKPGKPVILSIVEGKPVIGLPGYPVSAYIDFENFVRPVMDLYSGEMNSSRNVMKAVLSKRLVSSLKHKEYVRVKVGKVDDRFVASPLARGAGAAMSLVRADGFCIIEKNSEGYEAGETVSVELFRDIEEISNTVVAIGSHDLILDILADRMPLAHPGIYLSSTHVGSMAGLMALKRREAHIAPTHLLDEDTGVYNIPYLKRLFSDRDMVLIKGVRRIQGIIVKKGNPLGIKEIRDLTGVNYVNRQRGAGTRVFLDYKLKEAGIAPSEVNGYDREAATHMAVAALVKNGGADAGMGIYSAAKAMDLDFIPVGEEEYDFATEKKNMELPKMQAFIEVLKSSGFKEKAMTIGGYELSMAGEIIEV